MTIRIVGAGPIGQALAWLLASCSNFRVSLVSRSGVKSSVQVSGVSVQLCESINSPDIVILACKAFDLTQAVREEVLLKPKLMMICSNGDLSMLLGTFREDYPMIFWQRAIVTFGAKYQEQGIWLSESGQVFFQDEQLQNPVLKRWFALLPALPRWQSLPSIRAFEQQKWWLNTTLNTTLACCGLIFNGSALTEKVLLQEMGREAYALGFRLHGSWQKSFEELWLWLLNIIESTAANKNSTAYDVARGRQSELEFLAGLAGRFPGEYPRLEAASLLFNR